MITDRRRFNRPLRAKREERTVYKPTGDVFASVNSSLLGFREAQRTISEGHAYQLLGKHDRLDIGGSFMTQKVTRELGSYQLLTLSSDTGPGTPWGFLRTATGLPIPGAALRALGPQSGVDSNALIDQILLGCSDYLTANTMDVFGTLAIDRVKPTNPTVDLSISLGEFISERKFFALPGRADGPAGEYLNYMFGVAPTLADIQDLRTAILKREEITAQYVRDSGRLIRRRYEPSAVHQSEQKSVQTGVALEFYPQGVLGDGAYLTRSGTVTKITRTTTKMWFSGAFTYFLPEEGVLRDLAILDRLYGVKPGSSLAWELLPYSWLLDYKLSSGAVISNIDSFVQDGLVMPYAYVMSTQTKREEYTWSGEVCVNNTWTPISVSGTVTSVTKQRRPATPFGFGLLPGDLSARQWSIIAALGLSKFER